MTERTGLARTISSQLITYIRNRILDGSYAAGTALLQDAIAAEFGVSKIPVREALVQLSAEGLVDVFAHRGFQVRGTSVSELDELFRLRLQIEPDAVANGARLATTAEQREVKQLLDALNAATESQDPKVADLNRSFHLALICPAQQPITAEVLGRLLVRSQRYVLRHLAPQGRTRRAKTEHNVLHRLWLKQDADGLQEATRTHIVRTHDDLRQLLSAH
ncbi:GntR family transcriptional regulator [Ahniella affigens]|uniref:GntR family transcriptional regulator n=1 Tax=Ahniella affigens TaxID=2021234 RepID=A0A2P1PXL3_9GAMM|nr:GntR family transcriptional regulator [Ahniella affigens]AVP99593.1 GntR family transcriptional regulator [Ahniella affigens]